MLHDTLRSNPFFLKQFLIEYKVYITWTTSEKNFFDFKKRLIVYNFLKFAAILAHHSS